MKKIIITFGLIYGIYSIISSYLILNQTVGFWTVTGISLLIGLIIYFLGIRNYKSENGDFASFKEVFLLCMGISIIGLAISTIGQQAYTLTMSEDRKEELKTKFIDSQLATYENMGLDTTVEMEDELIKAGDEMFNFSIQNIILGLLGGLLGSALFSVIFALIFKKDPPIPAV